MQWKADVQKRKSIAYDVAVAQDFNRTVKSNLTSSQWFQWTAATVETDFKLSRL